MKEDHRIPNFIPIPAQNIRNFQEYLCSIEKTQFQPINDYPASLEVRLPSILFKLAYLKDRNRWKKDIKNEIH